MRDLIIFFFNDTATTEIYTLSLHDALPISQETPGFTRGPAYDKLGWRASDQHPLYFERCRDRKSTRLNSSHANISYAVFCLKKQRNLNRSRDLVQITLTSRTLN